MCIGTKTYCPICGAVVIQSGKGKPRDYCSDNCRDTFKYINALERNLNKIDFKNKDCAKQLKGDIWSVSNLIKIPK